MAKTKNLRPVRTKEEARARGANGGKASGEARRKKKLMSQIYGELLAERFSVKIDGKDQKITGEKLINRVVKQVLIAGGASAVSLLKEIREATEGNKLNFGSSDLTFSVSFVSPKDAGNQDK